LYTQVYLFIYLCLALILPICNLLLALIQRIGKTEEKNVIVSLLINSEQAVCCTVESHKAQALVLGVI